MFWSINCEKQKHSNNSDYLRGFENNISSFLQEIQLLGFKNHIIFLKIR